MDPRVKMSRAELEEQADFVAATLPTCGPVSQPIGKIFDSLVEQLTKLRDQSLPKNVEERLNALNSKVKGAGTSQPATGCDSFSARSGFGQDLFRKFKASTPPPTDRVKAAVNDVRAQATELTKRWKEIVEQEMPALDQELQAAGLPRLSLAK